MIVNPDWFKPKEKPYFHQISLDCIDKLVRCIERFNKGEIDADTSFKISKQILVDEFEDTEYYCLIKTPFVIARKSSFILSHHLS
jgi:hypothetical protein